MGVINHNAVIATTYGKDHFDKMKAWIDQLRLEPSTGGLDLKRLFVFGPGIVNDYHTIVLLPDGSKEGWPESEKGDNLRKLFIDRLNAEAFSDDEEFEDAPPQKVGDQEIYGCSSWDWIEVSFGEFGQSILKGNNRNCYGA